jgi:hypothetical protein
MYGLQTSMEFSLSMFHSLSTFSAKLGYAPYPDWQSSYIRGLLLFVAIGFVVEDKILHQRTMERCVDRYKKSLISDRH